MKIVCPTCAEKLEVAPEAAGQVVNCPSCNGKMTVPQLVALAEGSDYEEFDDVPWYRGEPGGAVFLLAIFIPIISIILCIICLTGDVYKDSYNAAGERQVWGTANKFAAVAIVIIQIIVILMFWHFT
jgi:hypothetical protein